MRESGELNPFLGPRQAPGGAGMVLALSSQDLKLSWLSPD